MEEIEKQIKKMEDRKVKLKILIKELQSSLIWEKNQSEMTY